NVDGVWNPVDMKQVNDLGEVYRERDMAGTITRTTKNSLGQPLRRYVGTIDDAWLNMVNGSVPQGSDNNLVLVERTEYGDSPNDAWLPTTVRRYNTNSGLDGNWHERPYDTPPQQDPHGQATVTSYDWRMR